MEIVKIHSGPLNFLIQGTVCLFAFLVFNTSACAQGGTWVWMHGRAAYNDTGHYGKLGVEDTANNPPARYEPAYWTDNSGNFWMFGGLADTFYHFYNDLWKFDITTQKWVWVNGARHLKNPSGVYGSKGIPSKSNFPPSRGYGSVTWIDKSGDLWLFGGYGIDSTGYSNLLTDLWRYNIAKNEWTWMSGPKAGYVATVFGTKGVAAASNRPGSRCESKSGWVDGHNNLWLYGGESYDSSKKLGQINDLWKYDINTNTWTWMKGNKTDKTSKGRYGKLNVEDTANLPPGRLSYTKWKDKAGNFYIYSGYTNFGNLNDVWRFNPHTNNWTWIAGDSTLNDTGVYKKKCVKGTGNYPASRMENQTPALQPDYCSNIFWVFAGVVADSMSNDLWAFNSDTKQWTWVSGVRAADAGKFGKKGLASLSNRIPARIGVAMWTDKLNNLWVFGGLGLRELRNDLWKFIPDTTCISFKTNRNGMASAPADTLLCPGKYATLSILNLDNVSYFPNAGVSKFDSVTLRFQPAATTKYGLSYAVCDYLDTLLFTMHVLSNDSATVFPSICSNKIYTLPGGTKVNSPGLYIDTLINHRGCDSIIRTTLSVRPVSHTVSNPAVCDGTRYRLPKGRVVTATGIYFDTLRNMYACDSCLVANLTVLPVSLVNLTVNLCPGHTYVLPKGEQVSGPGVYRDTLLNYVHCDSIIYTTVRLLHGNIIDDTVTICSGQSYKLRKGERVSLAGTYADSFINVLGCDSIYFTTLQVQEPLRTYTKNVTVCYYDSVLIDGGVQGADYAWSTGSSDKTVFASSGGYYTVQITVSPCPPVTDTFFVILKQCDTLLQIPSAFTPNSDGINDIFFPIRLGSITILQFRVYDRWGVLIYDRPIRGWDGTYQGVPQPQGTYIYTVVAEYVSGSAVKKLTKKGDVALIR